MNQNNCELGMIGLGVMGCNLVLNMAEHGFRTAGYDKEASKVQALAQQAQGRQACAAGELRAFFEALRG